MAGTVEIPGLSAPPYAKNPAVTVAHLSWISFTFGKAIISFYHEDIFGYFPDSSHERRREIRLVNSKKYCKSAMVGWSFTRKRPVCWPRNASSTSRVAPCTVKAWPISVSVNSSPASFLIMRMRRGAMTPGRKWH